MTRLNWSSRQSPTDLDSPPPKPTYEFDLRRNTIPGGQSWPERLQGEKFGPRFIEKAWKARLIVIAEIADYPHPVAAVETRWNKTKALEVKDQGRWHIPDRLYTRRSVKGLMATGELLDDKER